MHDLRSGAYADTMEIARRFKLHDAHVRRLLRFGYLAPDTSKPSWRVDSPDL
jgi:hypothetical protein